MAFADATVEASADFARFDREFPSRLRSSVSRATRAVVTEFRRAGTQAGRAFADAVSGQFSRITRAARLAGAEAGRAFSTAAEAFTRDIDVGFNLRAADGTRLGQQFRAAAQRATRRIPISFASTPPARSVGRITGQRFRAGAREFTENIPVTFDRSRVPAQGIAGGRAYRRAASGQTADIPVSFTVRDANKSLARLRGLLGSVAAGFGSVLRAALALTRVVAVVAAVTAGVAALVAFVGEAVFAVAAFARSLGGIGPILSGLALAFGAVAVAGIGALVAALITLGVAFRGVGDAVSAGLDDDLDKFNEALKELTPSAQAAARAMVTFGRPFRALIQERFFEQLTGNLAALVAAGPRVQAVFGNLAASLGTIANALLRTAVATPVLDRLVAAGDNIGITFSRLAITIEPILNGISLLALEGSRLLITLAGAAQTAAESFEGWVERGVATGAIEEALTRVLNTLRSLAIFARNVGIVFLALDASIQRVTGSSAGFGSVLQTASAALASFVQSEQGMLLLDTFFSSLRITVEALRPAFQSLPSLINPIVTLVAGIATGLGPGLAAGLNALSEAIQGLSDSGISQGFGQALGDALAAIGRGLGPVLEIIGRLTAALGPGLAAGLDALGRGLTALIPAAGPVGTALGGLLEIIGILSEVVLAAAGPLLQILGITLSQILAELNPVLRVLAGIVVQVAGAFSDWIGSPQVQANIERGMVLIGQLGQVLVTAFSDIGPILAETATQFLDALVPAFTILSRSIIDSGLLDAIGQLAVALGQLLANHLRTLSPLLTTLATTIATTLDQNAVPALQAFFTAIADVVTQIAEWMSDPATSQLFVQLITNLGNAMLVLARETGPLIQVFSELAVAFIPLIPEFAKLSLELSRLLLPLVTLAVRIVGLVGINVVSRALRIFVGVIISLLTPIRVFAALIGFVRDLLADFSLSDIINAFTALAARIGQAISSLPQLLADAFTNAVRFAFEALGFALGSIVRLFFELGTRIGDALRVTGEAISTFFTNLFNDPIGTITAAAESVLRVLRALAESVIAPLVSLRDTVTTFLRDMWNRGVQFVTDGAARIVQVIRDLPGRLLSFLGQLENIGSQLIQGFVRGLSNVGGSIGDLVDSIGRRLKTWINNNVIGQLERGIERAFGGTIDINIPRLAKGAYLTKPTMALVAEAGPEVVIPLNNPARAQQLVDESGLSNIVNLQRQAVTNVRVFIGQRELTDIVRVETDQAIAAQGEALSNGPRFVGA